MKTFIFLILTMIFSTLSTISQTPPPIENGVSHELAIWRAKHYSDVRYKLNLTLEKMSSVLKGEIVVSVNVRQSDGETERKDALTPIVLDWRKIKGKEDAYSIKDVELNGKPAEFEEINEHLVFKNAKHGENVVKLKFTSPISTSGSAITRYVDKEDGSEYIYSLFVPSDASTAFPVFDQPDLKAKFKLTLETPLDWKVIANSNVSLFVKTGPYGSPNLGNVFFAEETPPISTYVFAFAAGNFEEISEPNNLKSEILNLKSKIYVRKSQAEKFKQHSAEVFRLNRECIKYLEGYFDYKFPFPKYDLVLIPEFPFGGMEHAGATFLRESSIIFPSEPTKNDIISRANLIFHEAAHQWFGDTVTMKWFDDLWLKEGFAEFMAYKTLEKVMPEANAWKAFYERNKQLAYLTDSTKGTTPIYQEIANLSSAKSAYGNIVYRKAPSFLRQAEFYLGEKEFQLAVRSFLKKNEFKNATWQDLVAEFEIASKKKLQDWAKNWVTQRGMPIFRMDKKNVHVGNPPSDAFVEYTWNQKDSLESGSRWDVKTTAILGYEEGNSYRKVLQKGGINSLIQVWTCCPPHPIDKLPEFIFPNYQDYGYGNFLLDEKSRNYILANVQNEKDDFLRSMMYGSLWDSVREAELEPKDFVELAIKNVGTEKDEMIVSAILSRVNTAFAHYLDEKTKESLAEKLEDVLIIQLTSAKTKSLRNTFYRAFLNIVSTKKGAFALENILSSNIEATPTELEKARKATSDNNKKGEFAGLPILSTKDKFDAVTKLFILNYETAQKRFDELVKTETSDDAKRYAYAARAGIATAENKAKYFNDFVANKEISENWIESAFAQFNSTKHSELTLPYLEKALAELPNLKRNRKIFFVNGWLSAFIGGQKSVEALGIVNKFLADNPKLDKDLRLKILENADVIERAVKIRGKFGK